MCNNMNNRKDIYINDFRERYPKLEHLIPKILDCVCMMKESVVNGGKLLFCGNGGSAADSEHIVGELMKGFKLKRSIGQALIQRIQKEYPDQFEYYYDNLQQGINAISLVSQNALTTAFSNDNAPNLIFAQQVLGYGKEKDVLFAISTSGSSVNVIHAAKIAKVLGLDIIGLTGESGGDLKSYANILINVPEIETYKIQESHLPVYHLICLLLEVELYGE